MKRILTYLVFSILVISCKQTDKADPNPGSTTPGDANVLVVSADSVKASLYAVEASSITFLNKAAGTASIKPGTVLVSSITDKAPLGFLRKVTSITESNGKLVCQTSQATLTDAIQNEKVSYSRKFTNNDVLSIDSSGKALASLRQASPQSEGISRIVARRIRGVDINCEVTLEPTFDFDLTVEKKEVKYFRVKTNVNSTAKIRGKVVTTRQVETDPIVLATFRLRPFVVWAGYVPIVFSPYIVLTAGADGSITSTMNMEAEGHLEASAGAQYDAAGWQNLSDVSSEGNKLDFAFQKKTAVSAWLRPSVEVRLYDLKDIQISLGVTLSLMGELTDSDYCGTLDWGAKVSGKIFVKIFDKSLVDYAGVLSDKKFRIFKGKSSDILDPIRIGDEAFGGVVFYLESNGRHGLVMTKPTLKFSSAWWPDNAPYVKNVPQETAVGTGQANTARLIGTSKAPYVAGVCNDLILNECYDDWFLPSQDELLEIYKNISKLPGIELKGGYASSTLLDPDKSGILLINMGVDFDSGKVFNILLTDPQFLRRRDISAQFIPVRRF